MATSSRTHENGQRHTLQSTIGMVKRVHLPMHIVLQTSFARNKNAQGGEDGLVNEMLLALPWESFPVVRQAFESRLTSDWGRSAAPESCKKIVVFCIPRLPGTNSVTTLRPLALLAVFQKWFCSALSLLFLQSREPCIPEIYGFRAGHQCKEISESVRYMLQESDKWKEPIASAFDAIHRVYMLDTLSSSAVSPQFRFALIRKLIEAQVTYAICTSKTTPIPWMR